MVNSILSLKLLLKSWYWEGYEIIDKAYLTEALG